MSKRNKKGYKVDSEEQVNFVELTGILFLIIIFLGVFFFFQMDINLSPSKGSLTYAEAINSGNSSKCNLLKNSTLSKQCDLMTSSCESESCYLKKARITENEELCYKINNSNKRAGCSASIKHDNIFRSAVETNNISVCSQFSNDEKESDCRDNFYFAKAVNTQDKSYCEKINDEVIRDECSSQ